MSNTNTEPKIDKAPPAERWIWWCRTCGRDSLPGTVFHAGQCPGEPVRIRYVLHD